MAMEFNAIASSGSTRSRALSRAKYTPNGSPNDAFALSRRRDVALMRDRRLGRNESDANERRRCVTFDAMLVRARGSRVGMKLETNDDAIPRSMTIPRTSPRTTNAFARAKAYERRARQRGVECANGKRMVAFERRERRATRANAERDRSSEDFVGASDETTVRTKDSFANASKYASYDVAPVRRTGARAGDARIAGRGDARKREGGGWTPDDGGEWTNANERPREFNKFLIAGAFVMGIGAGVVFDTAVDLEPSNVASREILDRRTPSSELCMANGASAMVFDQRVFLSLNPFNVYVAQPEVKPGCVLRRSNWSVLERRNVVDKKTEDVCKSHMNTFAFVGDLDKAPEVSCVYHSEDAENQFMKDPSKAVLGDGVVQTMRDRIDAQGGTQQFR